LRTVAENDIGQCGLEVCDLAEQRIISYVEFFLYLLEVRKSRLELIGLILDIESLDLPVELGRQLSNSLVKLRRVLQLLLRRCLLLFNQLKSLHKINSQAIAICDGGSETCQPGFEVYLKLVQDSLQSRRLNVQIEFALIHFLETLDCVQSLVNLDCLEGFRLRR
jgi:hypothetical protein